MKYPARIGTLYRMAVEVGWGFVQTNQYGSAAKGHLLEMRRDSFSFVKNESWEHPMVSRYKMNIYGSDKLAWFYTITIKGLQELLKYYHETPELDGMKSRLFYTLFEEEDLEWVRYRL